MTTTATTAVATQKILQHFNCEVKASFLKFYVLCTSAGSVNILSLGKMHYLYVVHLTLLNNEYYFKHPR